MAHAYMGLHEQVLFHLGFYHDEQALDIIFAELNLHLFDLFITEFFMLLLSCLVHRQRLFDLALGFS